MDEDLIVPIVGWVTTGIIAVGGWVFSWMIHKDGQRKQNNAALIERLRKEVLARIELEIDANKWLAEVLDRAEGSVKEELRAKTKERTDARPSMYRTHRDLNPFD